MISLPLCSLLVFPQDIQDPEGRKEQDSNLAAEIDRVARVVLRCVLARVRPCCDDATDCADRDDVAARYGAYGGSSGVCAFMLETDLLSYEMQVVKGTI